jgi:hypothetical protein
MPATTTTIEKFPSSVPESQIKNLVQLRIDAGAIRSTYSTQGGEWVIETEWNVIGQQ